MEDEKCKMCGKPRVAHGAGVFHLFVAQESSGNLALAPQPVTEDKPVQATQVQLAIDPVLRGLLIAKGVISVEELNQMDEQLKTTGMIVVKQG